MFGTGAEADLVKAAVELVRNALSLAHEFGAIAPPPTHCNPSLGCPRAGL